MNLDELYDLAEGLVDSYADRNALYQNLDSIFNLEWNFPAGMPDWVMKSVATDPRDSVMTTVKTFATLEPQFKIMPMLPNQANRDRANQIETAIRYNFKQAGRRNDASVVWDVMFSATQYAEVAAQVIYLPYQEKILEAMGKDTRRVKAAKRFGDFAFIIHNPANVYPEWSEYGLEGVLTVRLQSWDEFVDSWGKLAEKLVKPTDSEGKYLEYVTVFDYTNYERRCVWAVCSQTETITTTPNIAAGGMKILDEENKLGFIPYAIRRWGNSLSLNTNERVIPLLSSVYSSGQWNMLNIIESLDVSLTLKRAAQPQYAAELPPGQNITLDNTEPVGVAELPAGTRQFQPLGSQPMDSRLAAEKGQYKSSIWQMSIPQVLQNLQFPSGTAYSSVNTVLGQAANSLAPYRMLGESVLSELAHLMLCWLKYYGKEYDKDVSLYGKYEDKANYGKDVRLRADELDPDALQIDVKLTADLPVDKLQQINGAVMLVNNFPIPKSDIIEDLGYGDAVDLAKRRYQEDYETAYIQTDIKRIVDAQQIETQGQMMQMQMGMQQQQQDQAMQQEMAAREQEAALAQAQQGGTPAQEQMQGMNPALGGMPPVQMANGQA